VPEPSKTANFSSTSDPLVKVEDLGSTTIDNIDVKGTRRTVTIPGQVNGTGAPLTVVDEFWYSEDLHLNLLLRHSDPRIGVQTVALSDLKREEPAQEFFEVPPGYKIVDMTPPADAPAARGAARSGPNSKARGQAALHQLCGPLDGFRLVAEALDPGHLRLPPEPGQLPLGVVAMALLRGGHGFGADSHCRLGRRLPDGSRASPEP